MARINFAGDRIGYIVRGKSDADHDPSVFKQHADCVLSSGTCVGFFGEGRGWSFGSSDSTGGPSSSGSSGFGMRGTVYDMDLLKQNRLPYVNAFVAQAYGIQSTLLVINTTQKLAQAFDAEWESMQANPPSFWILGANCSTRASRAFRRSGILSGGIPGLDTPNNLYKQLVQTLGHQTESHSGYIGFEEANQGYTVVVQGA